MCPRESTDVLNSCLVRDLLAQQTVTHPVLAICSLWVWEAGPALWAISARSHMFLWPIRTHSTRCSYVLIVKMLFLSTFSLYVCIYTHIHSCIYSIINCSRYCSYWWEYWRPYLLGASIPDVCVCVCFHEMCVIYGLCVRVWWMYVWDLKVCMYMYSVCKSHVHASCVYVC